MNKSAWIIALITLIIGSCSDDGEKPVYEFKEQPLSGKIGGAPWSYSAGIVSVTGEGEEGALHIDLLTDVKDPCAAFPGGDQVFFSVPNATGVYPLQFDSEDWMNSQTITLFDQEETANNIATEGAVEILSIRDTEVSGRIVAQIEGGDFVNGHFTVSFCQ